MSDGLCLMMAAHFNRSHCHTASTFLSWFDVQFKGLPCCQRLSSDTSPAINREHRVKQDLLTLSFSLFLFLFFLFFFYPKYQHFRVRDIRQLAEEISGPVVGQTWTAAKLLKVHTNKHSHGGGERRQKMDGWVRLI